jgi:hypothetical protein
MRLGFRIGRALNNDRERTGHRHTHDRCTLGVALLSIALMLAMVPAAVWLRPASLAQAQEEPARRRPAAAGSGDRAGHRAAAAAGEVAWTVRGITTFPATRRRG